MPLSVTAVKYSNEFGNIQSKNLKGGVGDFITIEHDFTVSWNTLDCNFNIDTTTKSISRQDCSKYNGSFLADGFSEGDTIRLQGTEYNDGIYTIYAINDSTIVTNEPLITETATASNIYGITPIDSFDFFYNFIGANQLNSTDNAFSFINDAKTVQKFSLPFSELLNDYYYGYGYGYGEVYGEYGNYMQPNTGNQTWFTDLINGNINGRPILFYIGTDNNYVQSYKIIFRTIINPLYTPTQLNLLQQAFSQSLGNNVAFTPPSYFQTNNPLVYAFKINVRANINSLTVLQTSNNPIATTGLNSLTNKEILNLPVPNPNSKVAQLVWFNQYYSGGTKDGLSKYYYKNPFSLASQGQYTTSLASNNAIDAGNSNSFIYYINNPNNLPISKIVLQFAWLPSKSTAFTGYSDANNITMENLMIIDRVTLTTSGVSYQGSNYGGSSQIFSNNIKFSNAAGQINIRGNIILGSNAFNVLSTNDDSNYMVWASFETDTTGLIDNQTHSPILLDVNQAFYYSVLSQSPGSSSSFFYKPDASDSGTSYFEGLAGDFGVFQSNCYLHQNLHKYRLNAVNIDISYYVWNNESSFDGKTYLEKITLENFSLNTASQFDGNNNNIDFVKSRNFNLPSSDLRGIISIINTVIEGNNNIQVNYGFQIGYQHWLFNQQLSQYNGISSKYAPGYTQGRIQSNTVGLVSASVYTGILLKCEYIVEQMDTGITVPYQNFNYVYAYDNYNNISGYTPTLKVYDLLGNDLQGQPPTSGNFILSAVFSNSSSISYTNLNPVIKAFYDISGTQYFDVNDYGNNFISPETIFTEVLSVSLSQDTKAVLVQAVCNFDNLNIENIDVNNFNFIASLNNIS